MQYEISLFFEFVYNNDECNDVIWQCIIIVIYVIIVIIVKSKIILIHLHYFGGNLLLVAMCLLFNLLFYSHFRLLLKSKLLKLVNYDKIRSLICECGLREIKCPFNS